jgi:hypothetical protein
MSAGAIQLTKETIYENYQLAIEGTVFELVGIEVEEASRNFLPLGIVVYPIVPGSTFYLVHGSNHCVVKSNTNILIIDDGDSEIVSANGESVGNTLN